MSDDESVAAELTEAASWAPDNAVNKALAAAETDAAQAKAAYREDPTPQRREAHREAQTALRDARWCARGGLDNPYGARTFADAVAAEKAQRRSGCYVTVAYEGDAVTFLYGDAVSAAEPFVHVDDSPGSDE